jgi:hypothetical protein
VLNAKKMNRLLTTSLIFFTVFAFSQDSIGIQLDSLTEEKQTVLSDSVQKKSSKLNDTIILDFDKNELLIPLERNNLTKVIMVKEKSKVDWLKWLLLPISSLFSLFLGIWLKAYFEKSSNKKKIEKSGERWVAELRSLEEPIKKQITSIEEYAEDCKKEDFKLRNLPVYSSLNGELFKSLDKNELIKYIEFKNKKTEFKEIVKISNSTNGYISILVQVYENLQEMVNKYLSQTVKHIDSLSISLQEFDRAFKYYGVDLERELNPDPLYGIMYKSITELYSSQVAPYLEKGNFNPFMLREKFFTPLLDILYRLRLDPRTDGLYSAMAKGLIAIKNIELEKDYMLNNLNGTITQYKIMLPELDKLINKIAKH